MNALLLILYLCLCLVCGVLICIFVQMMKFYFFEQVTVETVSDVENTEEDMEGEEYEKNESL